VTSDPLAADPLAADPFAVIRRIRESSARPRPAPGEACELCAEAVPEPHNHLVDLERRSLLCVCRGCYLLFAPDGAGGGHYRAVPERCLAFADLHLSPAQWEALQIPVSVAFFFVNSELGHVAAFYPSPAGATESLLPLDLWDELVLDHAELGELQPDVEALLVRVDRATAETECFLVPIDACYELVGHLRMLWRGFDGGREAHAAIDGFFDAVRARAR
jgi:hypothetical protein